MSWMASSPEMNCCMRSLRPSNAADMLTNMVSPPTAGTSLAHRTVAIGGSARKVSSECQTSVPNGGVGLVVAELDQLGRLLPSFGENGCTVSSPKRRPKSIKLLGRDVLIAKDDQLVLDQGLLDRAELRRPTAAGADRRR